MMMTEYLAALGWPDPSSFDTRTLEVEQEIVKVSDIELKQLHIDSIYPIAALIPMKNTPSQPLMFILKHKQRVGLWMNE